MQFPTARVQAFVLFVLFVVPPASVTAFALTQTSVDPVDLFRDPLIIATERSGALTEEGVPVFCCQTWLGAASNLGVLVWAATAGALFAGFLATLAQVQSAPRPRAFLALSFGLTTMLALDDLFQLHETGGLPVLLLLGVLACAYLAFWRVLWTRYTIVLIGAGLLLGASLVVDQVLPQSDAVILAEDVMKLFGIFLWSLYHVMLAVELALARGVFFRSPGTAVRRDSDPAL